MMETLLKLPGQHSGAGENIPAYDFDDDLMDKLENSATPLLKVYPFPFRAIVAGRGSCLDQEIRLDRALADHVPVYRRKGGGCSVFLDPGNLIVSIAFPARGFSGIQQLFNMASQWLIRALSNLNIKGINQDGVSDLVIDSQKIGGSCFYRAKGLGYYSASILVAPDLAAMAHYLKYPPREPDYRKGRSHGNFVQGLGTFFPDLTADFLARQLQKSLAFEMNRV